MRQADVEFSVRTDLALEERERIRGSESGIPGIRVQEREKKEVGSFVWYKYTIKYNCGKIVTFP